MTPLNRTLIIVAAVILAAVAPMLLSFMRRTGPTEAHPIKPKDWGFVINNGIRTPSFESLPPGWALLSTCVLGDRYFAQAGVYTVRWEGKHCGTRDLTF